MYDFEGRVLKIQIFGLSADSLLQYPRFCFLRTRPIVIGWLLSAPHQQKALGQLKGGTNGWTHPFVVMTKATDWREAMLRGSQTARKIKRRGI